MVGFFRASYCPVNLGPSELTTYILLPINNLFWCLCYKLSVFNLQCLSGFYHFLLVLISKIYIYFFSREKDYSDINSLLHEIHVFFFFFQGSAVVLCLMTKALEYLWYFYFSRPPSIIHLLKNTSLN